MRNDQDETAFPVVENDPILGTRVSQGMSLRDYFAAKVIAGLYSDSGHVDSSYESIAVMAYRQADAMMEARKSLG